MIEISIWQKIAQSFYNNFILEDRYMHLLEGLKTTLVITFFAVIIGTCSVEPCVGCG